MGKVKSGKRLGTGRRTRGLYITRSVQRTETSDLCQGRVALSLFFPL